MVQDPTRGENYLDLFLTNHPNLVPRTEILPGLADHDAVYMELQVHPPKKYQPKRLIPIYTEECKEPLKDAARQLNNRIMSVFNENSGVEDIWTELKTGLSQALIEHVPHKQTKSKPSHPWVDHETKKLIQRRNRIHKRWKKCGDEDLKQEFKLLKRQVQKSLRRLYWRHAEYLISDDVTNPTSSKKKFWCFIKARITEGMGVSPLKHTGKLITDPKEQAQLLNNQFCSVFSPRDTVTAEEFKLRCPTKPDLPEYTDCKKHQHY